MKQLLEKNGLFIDDAAIVRLEKYLELLIEWNKQMDLTSVPDEEMAERHFVDSLLPLTIENLFPEFRLDGLEIFPANCPEHIPFPYNFRIFRTGLHIDRRRLCGLYGFINPGLYIALQDVVCGKASAAFGHDVLDLILRKALGFQITAFE